MSERAHDLDNITGQDRGGGKGSDKDDSAPSAGLVPARRTSARDNCQTANNFRSRSIWIFDISGFSNTNTFQRKKIIIIIIIIIIIRKKKVRWLKKKNHWGRPNLNVKRTTIIQSSTSPLLSKRAQRNRDTTIIYSGKTKKEKKKNLPSSTRDSFAREKKMYNRFFSLSHFSLSLSFSFFFVF